MLARGLSVCDIEDTFRNGSLLLSRTAVSEIGERLWQDDQAFVTWRLRHRLPVRRRHCGADPPGPAPRAGPGRLGPDP